MEAGESILAKIGDAVRATITSTEALNQFNKRMAITAQVVNTAGRVGALFKQMPPREKPPGWPFVKRYWRRPGGMRKKRAALMIAMTIMVTSSAAQMATIISQPIPKFKNGNRSN